MSLWLPLLLLLVTLFQREVGMKKELYCGNKMKIQYKIIFQGRVGNF